MRVGLAVWVSPILIYADLTNKVMRMTLLARLVMKKEVPIKSVYKEYIDNKVEPEELVTQSLRHKVAAQHSYNNPNMAVAKIRENNKKQKVSRSSSLGHRKLTQIGSKRTYYAFYIIFSPSFIHTAAVVSESHP